ncbi:SDR family NAD(P)-dependent oxidoreductase [Legionella sp. W05-934-2]|jgi:NAD(P)-dependent dehydrogenase (short-subunit alcohol dehydrogenase family)|uniref:SDR family NAD(P)-dependent oxidoreductase n=1 Tax=Legionella sp. W05-934-2 TaxID=1198649 RepID=UPI00346241B0
MNQDNLVVLVTGAASGMGLACATYFAEQGATVMGWDKNTQQVTTSKRMHYLNCDVSQSDDVEKAYSQTCHVMGIPRVVINCAGIAPAKRMAGRDGPMPLEQFQQVINVNLVGTFNVMRVAAYGMTQLSLEENERERGVIINTASIAAYEGQIGQLAYSASKGGVVAMTLPAARELASMSIRVNTIAPGLVATPLLLNMPEEVQESLANTVTFPKRLGAPEEFARLCGHIVTNEYINGEIIRLDGALRMQAK